MNKLTVGIADMKMARDEGVLITYALGSCIGICLYDPFIRLGALVHVMLPLNMEANRTSPLKYADTGIRLTISKMEQRGARRSRLVAKIAGGAKMFDVAGNGSLGSIGQRNIDSVHQVLQQERVRLLREDVGGRSARTLLFDVATGEGCINVVGKAEKIL